MYIDAITTPQRITPVTNTKYKNTIDTYHINNADKLYKCNHCNTTHHISNRMFTLCEIDLQTPTKHQIINKVRFPTFCLKIWDTQSLDL